MKKELIYPVLLAIVSVVAGLAIGLTIARKPRYDFRPRFEGKGMMECDMRNKDMGRNDEIFEKISRRLKLSDGQKEEVKNILKSSRDEANEVFKASKDKLAGLKERTNTKIRAILSKDQQAEFDKMIGEMKGKMDRFKERRMPGIK
ncbi:MAG: hypothetical protein PHP89_05240 [Candidatus Omnitrophica bacterium]|nr:hypothetical protein [Candidatus Omnitrophota bacterium]MDD3988412.1 hypothetical protein [Candidatus Omnitrophota bacterium]